MNIKLNQKIQLECATPFGDDQFWLTLDEEYLGSFSSGMDDYEIKKGDCSVENQKLAIKLQILTPIKDILIISFDESMEKGFISVGDYCLMPFIVRGLGN